MNSKQGKLVFEQIHIDVARNATDDFNPFHDKNKWQKIANNPFNGPIILGFQLVCLLEDKIRQHREIHHENELIAKHNLRYSNYQISFANAVKPSSEIAIDIRKSNLTIEENACSLSNRISIKSNGHLDLIGYKKETQNPLYLDDASMPTIEGLHTQKDRSYIPGSPYFLKRKYMNTSNAKNFLAGSLVEQSDYFDELEEKIIFPEMFPCGLLSCALLERAMKEKHDFLSNPMVYISHKISVDRDHLTHVKSNTVLHMLVRKTPPSSTSVDNPKDIHIYECFGIIDDNRLLFRALISLAPLETIATCKRTKNNSLS